MLIASSHAKWKYLQINTFNTTIRLTQVAKIMSAPSLSTTTVHPIQLCLINDTLQLLAYTWSNKCALSPSPQTCTSLPPHYLSSHQLVTSAPYP